jgi:hypothetical protein
MGKSAAVIHVFLTVFNIEITPHATFRSEPVKTRFGRIVVGIVLETKDPSDCVNFSP